MRKCVQESIYHTYCDATGKRIFNGDRCSSLCLEFLTKRKGVKNPDFEDFEDAEIFIDLNEDVSREVFNYLAKKYPKIKQMLKPDFKPIKRE